MKKPKPTEAVLHLNLKREFFAAIAAGEKTTEYRDIKPYWPTRLATAQKLPGTRSWHD